MCCFIKSIWFFVKSILQTVCYCCTCALQTLCCMVFVVVIICLAIGLGVYFGVFHNRDSDDNTTTTPRSLILNALMPDAFREEKESTWVY
ncbi:uncharacterized protein LOC128708866 [Anopheles marshallii]|uniref:uncharacterized protein LOC128708866 n=1 Tax=Anopheles marshallii TaxID=1521116 RepID=UPI00237A96E0|nr:uncharacterized protein LOC128708866 [Anopheles marshallii]